MSLDSGQNAITDEFGFYRIENVTAGTYTITASATGYADKAQAGFVAGEGAGFDAALTAQSESSGGVDLVNVYATVSCVYSGVMLSGVSVKAAGAEGTYLTTTDQNGCASFMALPAGSYTFTINQSGRPGWESYTSSSQDLAGDYNLNCALKPNYQSLTIHVKKSYDPVTQTANVPLANAKVKLIGVDPRNENKTLISREEKTDEDGNVTVENLVPITWKISSSDFAYIETEATVYSNGAGKLSKEDLTPDPSI